MSHSGATTICLTSVQKGILYESLKENRKSVYTGQMVIEVPGELNPQILARAVRCLGERHPVVRSCVQFDPEVRLKFSDATPPFQFLDFTADQEGDPRELFEGFLTKDRMQSFDLTRAPLMRFALIKLAEDSHKLVWTRHHIVMDGASSQSLIGELLTSYTVLAKGGRPLFKEPSPYAEVIGRIVAEEDGENGTAWLDFLGDNEDTLSKPPPSKPYRERSGHLTLSGCVEDEYLSIKSFCRDYKISTNVLLQAAWALVISVFSSRRSFVFGSVRAYPTEVTGDAAGLFINTLPMLVRLDDELKVIEYLTYVARQNAFIKEHRYTPLDKIKKCLGLSLDAPLFESIVDYKPSWMNARHRTGDDGLIKMNLILETPYPIVLEISDTSESLSIKFHFEESLYEEHHAEQILQYFQRFVILLVKFPQAILKDLPHHSSSWLATIAAWNDTSSDYSIDHTVHDLFEKVVEMNPALPAVIYQEETLTYRALNARANTLAYQILEKCAESDRVIGICLNASLELIVSKLAVLKAGCSYVYLDPQHPQARLSHILRDCRPSLLITRTDSWRTEVDEANRPTKMIFLDEGDPNPDDRPNPNLKNSPTRVMYLNYTSGTTGFPKGVLIEHRSIVNTAKACINTFKLNTESRVLQLCSFNFDVAVAEWTMTLLAGACLYLTHKKYFSPEEIVHELRSRRITTIMTTCATLSALPHEALPNLVCVAVGGELLPQKLAAKWRRNRSFYNIFGVTEAAICSTIRNCSNSSCSATLGRPLPNTGIYVVNRHLTPVPPYGIGEICLTGAGIGQKYLNNPDLNQEKFRPSPFFHHSSGHDDNRCYRTGDIGRWLPCGEIELLGREDDQVKIKGVRVELPEIERILESFAGIEKAVALVDRRSRYPGLCACVQPGDLNASINIQDLKAHAGRHLPSQTVPNPIYIVKEWPLTSNGKIDKRLLLSSVRPGVTPEKTLEANDPIEKKITQIARTLLRKTINLSDTFSDLGMDSLVLVDFSLQLTRALGIHVGIPLLFKFPTGKALAAHLSSLRDGTESTVSNSMSVRERHEVRHKKKRVKFDNDPQ